jgi:hypothetical protein
MLFLYVPPVAPSPFSSSASSFFPPLIFHPNSHTSLPPRHLPASYIDEALAHTVNRLPPMSATHRVFGSTVLGGDPTRPVLNRKRSRVRLPTREVKPCSTRVFVAVHLHASGAGMGLGGELFVFSFVLFFSTREETQGRLDR